MADASTVNKIGQAVADVIKEVDEGIAPPIIIAAIIAQNPIWGLWGLKWILTKFVTWVGTYFYKYSAQATTKVIIDIQINGENSMAHNAADELKAADESGDPDAQAKALDDFAKAYAALVHTDGSVTI